MKNNIVFNLAKASVLKDKKNYIISFCMMLIAFLFTFIFSGYLALSEESLNIEKRLKYGGWNVCLENQNQAVIELFLENDSVDAIASLDVHAVFSNGDYIANYSSDYFTMNNVKLIDGRLPSSSHEVVVIERLGKIGDIISIETVFPSKEVKKFKVVGTINDYREYWSNPSAHIFGYNLDVYKNYTYISTTIPIGSLVEMDSAIYNFSLLPQDAYLQLENRGHHDTQSFHLGKTKENAMMNSFILVVSAGLLIAVFYNINQREKNVFLLRCIGMSKKNMRKYIFYEVIIVAIVSLVLSLLLGSLVLLGFSIHNYHKINTFLFIPAFIKSLTYIAVLLILLVCFVYCSIFPISIHSMDSLIHKKERKVMKKYHKAKRMTIRRLTDKIAGRYVHYIMAISSLIIVQTMCISTVLNDNADLEVVADSSSKYRYLMTYYDEQLVTSLEDAIVDREIIKYVQTYTKTFLSYDYLSSYGHEGELPQLTNENECYIFDYYELSQYEVGDKISYDSGELTIVGEIKLNELYHLYYMNAYYHYEMPVRDIMFVVKDDTFNESQWSYYTYMETNNNVFFEVSDSYKKVENIYTDYSYNRHGLYIENDIINSYENILNMNLIYYPIFMISLLFVVFIIRLLVDKLNKDFKLTRCLGMTFNQTMASYVHIVLLIVAYPIAYYTVILLGQYNLYNRYGGHISESVLYPVMHPFLIALIISSIHILGIMLYAYIKTKRTVTFYPTDVERYY